MSKLNEIQDQFVTLKCCVIVPTYNNDGTLADVVDRILLHTVNVIIVNDGSTDRTESILNQYDLPLTIIHIENNTGKGNALKVGLKQALNLGFDYAISIDSDGQHFPEDLPLFLKTLSSSSTKELLLVGARNLKADGMPSKNSFANKISNFWFWAETGIELVDTQSGFRLYPLAAIDELVLKGSKFEFEVEVMVKASWAGIVVENIPIQVYYHPTERVSHYRPFRDFVRISLMNARLFLMAVFFIKPRDFYRKFKEKGFKRFFYEDILRHQDSTLKKSLSIALGTFIGASPFWGFHTILAISVAAVLKLNKVISYTFSNVSFPIFIPFLIYGSLYIGGIILGNETSFRISQITQDFNLMKYLWQYIIGSFVLAAILGLVFGLIGYFAMQLHALIKGKLKHG